VLLLQLITHVISGSICDYRSSDWLTTHSAAELWTGCLPFQPQQILRVSCNSSSPRALNQRARPEELNNNLSFIVNLSEIKPVRTSSWPWCCTARGEEAGWRGSIGGQMEILMDDRWGGRVYVCVHVRVCVCVCVRGGIESPRVRLGREHSSGCLIDRSHLESFSRSPTGQRRDTPHPRPVVPKLRPAGRIRPPSTFGPAPWTIPEMHYDYFFHSGHADPRLAAVKWNVWRSRKGLLIFGYVAFWKTIHVYI